VQTTPLATLAPVAGGLGLSSSKGGATNLSQPISSLTMQGTCHGSSDPCKKRIWSRRNSRSDYSSIDNDLASSIESR
jgi:hypothetical protein